MNLRETVASWDEQTRDQVRRVIYLAFGLDRREADEIISGWVGDSEPPTWCSFTTQRGTCCRRDAHYGAFGWNACSYHLGSLAHLLADIASQRWKPLDPERDATGEGIPYITDAIAAAAVGAAREYRADGRLMPDFESAVDTEIIRRLETRDFGRPCVKDAFDNYIASAIKERWSA